MAGRRGNCSRATGWSARSTQVDQQFPALLECTSEPTRLTWCAEHERRRSRLLLWAGWLLRSRGCSCRRRHLGSGGPPHPQRWPGPRRAVLGSPRDRLLLLVRAGRAGKGLGGRWDGERGPHGCHSASSPCRPAFRDPGLRFPCAERQPGPPAVGQAAVAQNCEASPGLQVWWIAAALNCTQTRMAQAAAALGSTPRAPPPRRHALQHIPCRREPPLVCSRLVPHPTTCTPMPLP